MKPRIINIPYDAFRGMPYDGYTISNVNDIPHNFYVKLLSNENIKTPGGILKFWGIHFNNKKFFLLYNKSLGRHQIAEGEADKETVKKFREYIFENFKTYDPEAYIKSLQNYSFMKDTFLETRKNALKKDDGLRYDAMTKSFTIEEKNIRNKSILKDDFIIIEGKTMVVFHKVKEHIYTDINKQYKLVII
jgi:hypothetical protein